MKFLRASNLACENDAEDIDDARGDVPTKVTRKKPSQKS